MKEVGRDRKIFFCKHIEKKGKKNYEVGVGRGVKVENESKENKNICLHDILIFWSFE